MVTIGEAARRSGVGIEAIRYYERTGVVVGPARSQAGRRLYSADEINALRFIRRCRDLGFSLPDAKALLGIVRAPDFACDDALAVGLRQLRVIQQKICDLQQMQVALEKLMVPCRAGEQECAMLTTLFEASKRDW